MDTAPIEVSRFASSPTFLGGSEIGCRTNHDLIEAPKISYGNSDGNRRSPALLTEPLEHGTIKGVGNFNIA